jgi:hypothetical protein
MREQYSVPDLSDESRTRFWSKVKKGDECWLWTGATNKLGYGRVKLGGRIYYAHRVAFALEHGDSPTMRVTQRCGNSTCVNPEHLIALTVREHGIAAAQKPRKPRQRHHDAMLPYVNFPLFRHASGRWAKKLGGDLHYFGRWAHVKKGQLVPVEDVKASATAAKLELDRQWPYITEGRTPPAPGNEQPDVCTMKVLCNKFWQSKRAKLLAGELSQRSFADYERTTDLLTEFFSRTIFNRCGPPWRNGSVPWR